MARRAVQVNQNFLNVGHNKQTFMRDALLTKLESRVKHHVSMFVSIWQAPGRLPPSLEEGLERVRNSQRGTARPVSRAAAAATRRSARAVTADDRPAAQHATVTVPDVRTASPPLATGIPTAQVHNA